jgi:hypothetical protein
MNNRSVCVFLRRFFYYIGVSFFIFTGLAGLCSAIVVRNVSYCLSHSFGRDAKLWHDLYLLFCGNLSLMWQFARPNYPLYVAKRFRYSLKYTRNKCLCDNESLRTWKEPSHINITVLREWFNWGQMLAWGCFSCFYHCVWMLRDCKAWWLMRLLCTTSDNITEVVRKQNM